ncbi:glycogen/starch/alpha-glucan family phosphorylase [Acutalibacter sp. 1XD8-33]|uniref:glycogen/starch/alpha-glucan phosphorylase n=1 Tax=Acutalibacter sp. 1XD8-33 TaxID=2320081 RepID=UPI000EA2E88F|nr:glycogen/starch/alpha-glucan phosphorylase [Acutalibacter sp. 1XD8-33]RKJ42234.1 glycogen/starch/alpha-glucan family phosphorylase [Acutalibacter sp. 1XD8-33]
MIREELEKKLSGKSLSEAENAEIYGALLALTQERLQKAPRISGDRKLYYVSAEFLVGKLLSNNLINLGLFEEVRAALEEAGKSLSEIEEIEPEPSLGNGGLGRLAACYLDSAATLNLPADGVGLLYHFGLFRQSFWENKQYENPDRWLPTPDAPDTWLEKTGVSFSVPFPVGEVKSVMYDLVVSGYEAGSNRLHLFDLETVDEALVKDGIGFDKTAVDKNLTLFLYPDDSDDEGRLLRVYQQYFMVSNAAQLIIKELSAKGYALRDLWKHAVVQINDTHPSMIIPEFIRLMQKDGISMDEAISIVSKTCAYTNHTILAEALEKWPMHYLQKAVPGLVPIIEELDRRVREKFPDQEELYLIDKHNLVHMANMDIHYGFSVNGVAALHTDILKEAELKAFADAYPEKFNNKTNGVTFRRWLMHCDPELSGFITEKIGSGWKKNADELEKLLQFQDDPDTLDRLLQIKGEKKAQLCQYMKERAGVELDPESIFDVQIKRLHEYKRQQMNALYIIWKYQQIKAGNLPRRKITLLFGAKAAPAYIIAKDIIHLILCLSELIRNDPDVSPYLEVRMVENYNVTWAEKLIPACDISEQISLASKEASGTGNMKFMLNGAVTLGTEDGANVEIHELVGDENICIFGKSSDEVIDLYKEGEGRYKAADYYPADPEIEALLDFIISPTMMRLGDPENLGRLYKDMSRKDWFMALLDVKEYIAAKEGLLASYEDRRAWAKKMLVNIAKAGFFSSDRAIAQYNQDVWHLS